MKESISTTVVLPDGTEARLIISQEDNVLNFAIQTDLLPSPCSVFRIDWKGNFAPMVRRMQEIWSKETQ